VTQAIKSLSGDKYNKDTETAKSTDENRTNQVETSCSDTNDEKKPNDPLAELL
jgi:hypothetical protein